MMPKDEGKLPKMLVFLLGGATSDITILALDEGDYKDLASTGDKYLGGKYQAFWMVFVYILLVQVHTSQPDFTLSWH